MIKATTYLLAVILLSACTTTPATPTSISPEEAQQTAISFAWTSVVAAYTPTSTLTPTPVITKTPRPTFTPSNTPTATTPPLFEPKSDGFYLVNIDIAPGIWRNSGSGDKCYWSITTKTNDIIDNHYGMAGGTMYIPQEAFQVELLQCGTWEFLSAN